MRLSREFVTTEGTIEGVCPVCRGVHTFRKVKLKAREHGSDVAMLFWMCLCCGVLLKYKPTIGEPVESSEEEVKE